MTAKHFKAVRAAAAALPDVEVTTSWGAPALKVRGKMFVCQAINKSAEPNTLAVRMDFAQRDALRLSRVHPDALRDLVHGAYRFVSRAAPKRRERRTVSPRRAPRWRRAVSRRK